MQCWARNPVWASFNLDQMACQNVCTESGRVSVGMAGGSQHRNSGTDLSSQPSSAPWNWAWNRYTIPVKERLISAGWPSQIIVSISRGSKISSHFSENPWALLEQNQPRAVGLCRKHGLKQLLGKGLHSPASERCREAGAALWCREQLLIKNIEWKIILNPLTVLWPNYWAWLDNLALLLSVDFLRRLRTTLIQWQ